MKKALFLVYGATHFRELSRFALKLKQSNAYDPIVLFYESYPTRGDDEYVCYAHGIAAFRRTPAGIIRSPGPDPLIERRRAENNLPARRVSEGSCEPLLTQRAGTIKPADRQTSTDIAENTIQQQQSAEPNTLEASVLPTSPPDGSLPKRILKSILSHGTRHRIRRCAQLTKRFVFGLANPWKLTKAILRKSKARCVDFVRRHNLHNNTVAWYVQYRRLLSWVTRVVDRIQPDIIVLAEDNVEYGTGAFLRVARERGLKSIVIPYALAGPEEPAEVLYDNPKNRFSNLGNRLLGNLYPHWVYEHRGRKMVRVPAVRAFPLEWLKLSQPLPWVMNSSHADVLAVESRFMFEYYNRYGVPEDKMRITGALSDDTLHRHAHNAGEKRRDLCQSLGLSPDLPIILCALPPVHSGNMSWGTEFEDYEDMLDFWVHGLEQSHGHNIVLCLHPVHDYETMKRLEKRGARGPKIARRDTAELVPLCDIYVASISSTIRWAIACGKPVINYDVYRFRFTDFSTAPGVVTVEEKEDYISLVQRLTSDPEYYAHIAKLQEECKEKWGILDGKSGDRMVQLLNQLCHAGMPESEQISEFVRMDRHGMAGALNCHFSRKPIGASDDPVS